MTAAGTDEDRVTLGERYGSATASSNLRVGAERRSDADLVIAAGWLDDNLGALLFRLASEYDRAKGEHGIASAEFERAEAAAAKLEAHANRNKDAAARAVQLHQVRTMRHDAKAQALTSRAMILIHLKSLRETKQALHVVALQAVHRAGLDWDDRVVASLVGQCLDVHLDGTCHHCQGRGSNGGFGTPQTICRPCKGIGKRTSEDVGKDAVQREFAAWMLAEMRRLLGIAGAGIGRALGTSVRDDSRCEQARLELGQVLAAMRSPEAEADDHIEVIIASAASVPRIALPEVLRLRPAFIAETLLRALHGGSHIVWDEVGGRVLYRGPASGLQAAKWRVAALALVWAIGKTGIFQNGA